MSIRTCGVAALLFCFMGGNSYAEAQADQPAESQIRAATALEYDLVELLADLDPASTLSGLQETLAPKLNAAVALHFGKLNAGPEPTVIESADHRFIVVVIADASAAENGREVRAKSDAELLLVIGGRAGVRPSGAECYGGTGHAEASKGIGIALGGAGGAGNGDGVGAGGGGAAGASGLVGSLSLGGPAGKPASNGGRATDGTGTDPTNLPAIIHAATEWDHKR